RSPSKATESLPTPKWKEFFSSLLAPDIARKVLEDLEASKTAPACFDAGMALTHLDKGIWVPK
ncbi:MAG: hypothetical protein JWL62_1286, partial [Hyphomicrobiales bacterium]|nr:hypothetical protein [Hyphomicrobiales bacterium]